MVGDKGEMLPLGRDKAGAGGGCPGGTESAFPAWLGDVAAGCLDRSSRPPWSTGTDRQTWGSITAVRWPRRAQTLQMQVVKRPLKIS